MMTIAGERGGKATARQLQGDDEPICKVMLKRLQGDNEAMEMRRQSAMAPAWASLIEFVVQAQG